LSFRPGAGCFPPPAAARERVRAEVEATLRSAKLSPAELLPAAQCLSFGPGTAGPGECCLLQLEPGLCAQLEAGARYRIPLRRVGLGGGWEARGGGELSWAPGAVRKFYMSIFIYLFIYYCVLPIAGFSNNYWELRRCRPKLKKLRKLLMEDPYEGPDSGKDQTSAYTTEDLLSVVQASEEEIMHQLEVLDACKIEGFWRVLEFDYEMKLLNHVTQLIDSESWSLSKVPLRTCCSLFCYQKNKNPPYCVFCFSAGEVYFEMREDKICRAIAQMLLQNAVKFNLAEFQEVWQQSVPEGMTTRLDQLKGLALVDKNSRPETIFLLKVEDLPEDNQERFNSLFSVREKWTEEDITPYIQDLCSEKQTVGALLTKYARSSMQNGVKVYNSRRPIS
uniref:Sister chromatid cohesion protein DCC1 n=1 Tax=Cairina moschata TaxID=8855 RepID=A0A8C3C1I3_CAIMO